MMESFNRYVLLFCVLVLLVIAALSMQRAGLNKVPRVQMHVGEIQLQVETAKTALQIEKGLSDREELGSDGMLFYMPQRGKPLFWMKDMQFALDFIWITDGKVVDIHENVKAPEPNTPNSELVTITPIVNITHVLEVDAGFVKKYNIKIGDPVTIP